MEAALLEELDTTAITQRDDLSLVLLLQGLQSPQEGRLIQPMELWTGTEGHSGALGSSGDCGWPSPGAEPPRLRYEVATCATAATAPLPSMS